MKVTFEARIADGKLTVRDADGDKVSIGKGTITVDVRFPDGFSYQKLPGWRTRVFEEKLDTPVDLGGFSVDEQFTRVVWRARKPKRDRTAPASSRTSRSRSAFPSRSELAACLTSHALATEDISGGATVLAGKIGKADFTGKLYGHTDLPD